MKTIDIVTSAYNESGNLENLYKALEIEFETISDYTWQFIVSDNASTDNTWQEISRLKKVHSNIKAIQLSRNFGFENSILAALNQSDSDLIVIMTSDLQDDPKYIKKFLEFIEEGYDHVYQIVTDRPRISFIRKINSFLFYKIAKYLSRGQIKENVSEYCLITKPVKDILLSMPERNRFTRGLLSWMGFKSIGVPFSRLPREKGKSKATSISTISFAIRGILSHSYMLLDFISILGLILSSISFLLFIIFLGFWIFQGVQLYSLGFFTTLVSLGFGIILVALGVMSKYISLIYEEVKQRPHYIIRKKL